MNIMAEDDQSSVKSFAVIDDDQNSKEDDLQVGNYDTNETY